MLTYIVLGLCALVAVLVYARPTPDSTQGKGLAFLASGLSILFRWLQFGIARIQSVLEQHSQVPKRANSSVPSRSSASSERRGQGYDEILSKLATGVAPEQPNVPRDTFGHVLRTDLSSNFGQAHAKAQALLEMQWTFLGSSGTGYRLPYYPLEKLSNLARFSLSAPLGEAQLVLSRVPFSVLERLKSALPPNDPRWDKILTNSVLNDSMKWSEYAVRKSRLRVHTESVSKSGGKPGAWLPQLVPWTKDSFSAGSLAASASFLINWIPVFKAGRVDPSFRFRDLTTEELQHKYGPDPEPVEPSFTLGSPSVVPSFKQFLFNLEAFTGLPVVDILSEDSMLMGGAVLACLLPIPEEFMVPHLLAEERLFNILEDTKILPLPLARIVTDYLAEEPDQKALKKLKKELSKYYRNGLYANSDIDLFFAAHNEQQAREKIQSVVARFRDANEDSCQYLVRTNNAVTAVGLGDCRNVQMIPGERRLCLDLLMDFDLDCACFAFDGTQVLALPRARRAVNTRCNFVDPFVFRYARNRVRMAKYNRRGFRMMLYERCIHEPRCDVILDSEMQGWWSLALSAVIDEKNKETFNKAHGPKNRGIGPYPAIPYDAQAAIPTNRSLRRPAGRTRKSRLRLNETTDQVEDKDNSQNEDGEDENENWLQTPNSQGETVPGTVGSVGRNDWDIFHVSVSKSDGLIYSEGPIPSYARSIEQVKQRLSALDTKERSRHGVPVGDAFQPRFVHAENFDTLWKVNLKPPVRPKVGHDPERIITKCYMCSRPCQGEFRDRICGRCQLINKAALERSIDMSHRVAFITGGRTKLGFACALRLLRMGCAVTVTTRFPYLCLDKYRAEVDSSGWLGRLEVVGLDLRSIPALREFLQRYRSRNNRLDFIINNAAQTIQRPGTYYHSLAVKEDQLREAHSSAPLVSYVSTAAILELEGPSASSSSFSALLPAAALDNVNFPAGAVDPHGDPLDLRSFTSWNSTVEKVGWVELMEVMVVNVTAPFLIVSELSPLITKLHTAIDSKNLGRRFIINVSSSEGQFVTQEQKKSIHPHTNMAKAGLNMLTRTIAAQFAKQDVFVVSVDPGWVSDMRPMGVDKPVNDDLRTKAQKARVHVRPPLSVDDGAARILDPILKGVEFTDPLPKFGVFLKDFALSPW